MKKLEFTEGSRGNISLDKLFEHVSIKNSITGRQFLLSTRYPKYHEYINSFLKDETVSKLEIDWRPSRKAVGNTVKPVYNGVWRIDRLNQVDRLNTGSTE